MKKTITVILLVTFISLIVTSCGSPKASPDSRINSVQPTAPTAIQPTLEVIGSYKIQAGWLYVYKLNNDTIYLVEGKGESYPVTLQVKN